MGKFKTPYSDDLLRVKFEFTYPSQLEDAKQECDLSFIIENYVKTGMLPTKQASYIDCTTVPMYEEAMQIVAEANSNFEALPAKIRDEFKTVENYLNYVSDEKNLSDCINRGLIDKATVSEEKLAEIAKANLKQSQNVVDNQPVNPPVADVSAGSEEVSANS